MQRGIISLKMTARMGKMPSPSSKFGTGEDIVCAPRNRGNIYVEIVHVYSRREDRDERTSGLSAVTPVAPPSSYVRNG